jgi:hypothetical protein
MPNLASLNHSGYRYCLNDSRVGLYGPSFTGNGWALAIWTAADNVTVTAMVLYNFI